MRRILLAFGFLCNSLVFYGIGLSQSAVSINGGRNGANNLKEDGVVVVDDDVDREFIRSHFNDYQIKTELRNLLFTWTMVTKDHFDYAVDSVTKINKNNIDGDIVECGVWKGGMSMAMVLANQQDNIERKFWLFDTFEGLPPPASVKDDPKAKRVYSLLQNDQKKDPEISNRMKSKAIEKGKWNLGTILYVLYYIHTCHEK